MIEPNQTELEQTPRLDKFLEPYFAKYHRERCYPGLIFQQGKREMIQINVPADDLPTLLQAKPSTGNDPDSGKNRPEVKGHVEEVKEYVLERSKKNKSWLLGTLTANVNPDEITVVPLGRGICLVVIPRGIKLDITDGQHRKRAVHEIIESAEASLIADNDFPITLVLEKDFNQCQIDFKDMAQTRPLDKSLLLSFGEFEGRVGITKRLIESVSMFEDKTEKIKSSPSTKQKLIYTTNYLAKTVSYAFTNDSNDDLKGYEVEESSQALIKCLNQFFDECLQTKHISETNVEDLTVDEVAKFKQGCILGRSVGLEILGRLLYRTYNTATRDFDEEKVSQIAQLDWSTGSFLWDGNIVRKDPNPKDPMNPYTITASASPIKLAVNSALNTLGWIQFY